MKELIKQLRISLLFLSVLSVLTGLLYPGCVTFLAQVLFPYQAGGSLIQEKGKPIGSELIGQSFTGERYFWGRPSATPPYPYNAAASGGSNLGPTNPTFLKIIKERMDGLQKADPAQQKQIPLDLIMASGSGLDPHISPAAAFYQIQRVAMARGISEDKLSDLVKIYIEKPTLGILGDARVNVLKLNLALDRLSR
jgi:K+-transporting ATPase ATPase C chain